MKEVQYEDKTYGLLCPECGTNVTEHCGTYKNIINTIDVENVTGDKYGIQCRWKEVYICPKCGKKFYCVCEH